MNRAGSKHRCLIGGRRVDFQTVKGDFGSGKLVFGERADNPPVMSTVWNFTVLEAEGTGTRIRLESHYHARRIVEKLLIPIFRLAIKRVLTQLCADLKALCEGGYRAGQDPAASS